MVQRMLLNKSYKILYPLIIDMIVNNFHIVIVIDECRLKSKESVWRRIGRCHDSVKKLWYF